MSDAQPSAEPQRRIVRTVGRQVGVGSGGLCDDSAHIGTGQTRGDESEGRESAEASADRGVDEEGRKKALIGGQRLEFGSRIGDRDHPGRRIDADRLEGRGEAAADRIRLHRGSGLRRDDEDRVVEIGADRLGDLIGIRRVDDLEADTGRLSHHLGSER